MAKLYYGHQKEIPKMYNRPATLQEAYKKGQLRRYGLIKIDPAELNKIIDQTKSIAIKLKEEIVKNKNQKNIDHLTDKKMYNNALKFIKKIKDISNQKMALNNFRKNS